MKTQKHLEITPKKDIVFIRGDWDAKVGSQEIPGKTGKFALQVQNEVGQRLKEFCQHAYHSKHPFPATPETIVHMDITRQSILKSD